jgi:hypothetical protein
VHRGGTLPPRNLTNFGLDGRETGDQREKACKRKVKQGFISDYCPTKQVSQNAFRTVDHGSRVPEIQFPEIQCPLFFQIPDLIRYDQNTPNGGGQAIFVRFPPNLFLFTKP